MKAKFVFEALNEAILIKIDDDYLSDEEMEGAKQIKHPHHNLLMILFLGIYFIMHIN